MSLQLEMTLPLARFRNHFPLNQVLDLSVFNYHHHQQQQMSSTNSTPSDQTSCTPASDSFAASLSASAQMASAQMPYFNPFNSGYQSDFSS
ncbi:hypothetical protein WR25_12653 [Diploscapter pachys]|uniref:Uncharacterized protein n=1 Tax=Diploscapter pachys TaxID=2018661 RepID=A0A2A2LX35_9BILA|nr:hypothetical protein WR25_12653 [Diploscapter pachys]